MNKTVSEIELLKEFEHEFGAFAIMGKAGRFYNGAFANEARISDAKNFISRAFKAGQTQALDWVEKELDGLDCGFCNYGDEVKLRLEKLKQRKELSDTK